MRDAVGGFLDDVGTEPSPGAHQRRGARSVARAATGARRAGRRATGAAADPSAFDLGAQRAMERRRGAAVSHGHGKRCATTEAANPFAVTSRRDRPHAEWGVVSPANRRAVTRESRHRCPSKCRARPSMPRWRRFGRRGSAVAYCACRNTPWGYTLVAYPSRVCTSQSRRGGAPP